MQVQQQDKNSLLKWFLCAASISFISGCSSRVENAIELVQAAINGPQDYTLTPAEIKAYPYAAQYARFDEQPQNLLALSFTTPTIDQHETLSWVSATDEIITTLHGRVIHTAGVAGGIHHYSNLANDPLACFVANTNTNTNAPQTCPTEWQTTITVGGAHPHDVQQFAASSQFTLAGEHTLSMPNGNEVKALKLAETLQFNGESYTNTYFISTEDTAQTANTTQTANQQTVLQTRQIVSLDYGYLQLTQVKRYGGGYQAPNYTGPSQQSIQIAVQHPQGTSQTTVPAFTRVQQPVRTELLNNNYNPHDILWAHSRIISTSKQQAVSAQHQQAISTAAQISQALASSIQQWPIIGAEPASSIKLSARQDVQPGMPTHTAARAFHYYQAQYNPQANAALPANQSYRVIAPAQAPAFTLLDPANTQPSSTMQQLPYQPRLSAAEFVQRYAPHYRGATIQVADTQGVVKEVAAQNFNVTDYTLPLGAVILLPVTEDHANTTQLNQQLRELLPYVYTAHTSEQQQGGAQ